MCVYVSSCVCVCHFAWLLTSIWCEQNVDSVPVRGEARYEVTGSFGTNWNKLRTDWKPHTLWTNSWLIYSCFWKETHSDEQRCRGGRHRPCSSSVLRRWIAISQPRRAARELSYHITSHKSCYKADAAPDRCRGTTRAVLDTKAPGALLSNIFTLRVHLLCLKSCLSSVITSVALFRPNRGCVRWLFKKNIHVYRFLRFRDRQSN